MGFKVAPYIGFSGEAADALAFYQGVLGGELSMTRYSEMPMEDMDGEPEWVMHGDLTLSDGVTIMAADSPGEGTAGSRVDVILYGDDTEKLEAAFTALSEGGEVEMPFAQAPWGAYFGQFTDRFGVSWMIEGGSEEEPVEGEEEPVEVA